MKALMNLISRMFNRKEKMEDLSIEQRFIVLSLKETNK